jgi:hypothetical protein
MGLTREQRAERDAAKLAADAAAAEQRAAALDIAAAVASEDISKALRVYKDISGRVPMPSGALACVQREQRTDGSLGEYLLATIRISDRDKSESAQRVSIASVQSAIDALGAAGVTLFSAPVPA